MVQTEEEMRKAHFEASLALARTTARDWAKEHGVTAGHLSKVLKGERESASLTEKIDGFIAEHLRPMVPAA